MLKLDMQLTAWPLNAPFAISRAVQTQIDCLLLTLTDSGGVRGHSEAIGVDYAGELPATLMAELENLRPAIELGVSQNWVQSNLPAGGARNALDCAMWDLAAKQSGVPAWQTAGLAGLEPRPTAFTLGIMDDAALRASAMAHGEFAVLKVKTDRARGVDPARIVHEVAPHARLILDPNADWGESDLRRHASALPALNIALLEQPVAPADDIMLERLRLPVPVAADEACVDRHSLPSLAGRYQVLNIKLDKTGGLTEALALARDGAALGFDLMIGCMAGSSLSMAPAFLVAQLCRFVDLDGPLLQSGDVAHPIIYTNGVMLPPDRRLWG